MKVALVHDWLVGTGGAERCLECLGEMFPQADIYTLVHKQGSVSSAIASHRIVTSPLQRIPFSTTRYRYLLPFAPFAVERFDFSGYDLVVSGSACIAHGVIVPFDVPHVAYIYSPMRYIWDMTPIYMPGQQKRISLTAFVLNKLRVWNASSLLRPDVLVADSQFVARRIEKICRRTASVIYPPVDTVYWSGKHSGEQAKKPVGTGGYFLMVTSFEPNRRVDLAVAAFTTLGLPLKIVGSRGRFRKTYERLAGQTVEFVGHVGDTELRRLYAGAQALVTPGIEDFGIAPIEAMAAGTPVIAYAQSGAAESVVDMSKDAKNATGVLFDEPTAEALAEAVTEFMKSKHKIELPALKNRAALFSKDRFISSFLETVENTLAGYRRGRSMVSSGTF